MILHLPDGPRELARIIARELGDWTGAAEAQREGARLAALGDPSAAVWTWAARMLRRGRSMRPQTLCLIRALRMQSPARCRVQARRRLAWAMQTARQVRQASPLGRKSSAP